MKAIYREIKTGLDALSVFDLFKAEDEAVFLDSSMESESLGRYSIIVFNPFISFKGKGNRLTVERDGWEEIIYGSPFEKLRELLGEYQFKNETHLPFIGGGVGYLSYDLCRDIEKIPKTGKDDVGMPDIYFNFYKGSIVIDNIHKKTYVTYMDSDELEHEEYLEYVKGKIRNGRNGISSDKNLAQNESIESNFSKAGYLETIKKVKDYIKAGEVYEVNLTQRMECAISRPPYEIYKHLREINQAPFAAFMDLDGLSVICSSPERFIKLENGKIETRPIKGTIRRGENQEEDERNRKILSNSEKDKAENLMIVDLERNDLSKICKKKTVEVTELFGIEEYPTVFHMVSTVEGRLKEGIDSVDCLKATFPGGSITGAPKIRSMEIIDELEPNLRNIYTGSLGYIGYDGNVDLNIVIRTIVVKENRAYFGVGGAITWDSDEEAEYQETLDKARALMRVL